MAGIKHTGGIGLPDLRARLARVGSGGFRTLMAKNLGEEARRQLANSFRAERNPYGKAWAPLKQERPRDRRAAKRRRKGGRSALRGKILQDTGRMRAAVAVEATAAGFRIDIPVKYAPHHQYGAPRGRLPQRQMLPMVETGGLGPIWTPAFNQVAKDLIDRHLKAGG
jgi:phage gpG-like protein